MLQCQVEETGTHPPDKISEPSETVWLFFVFLICLDFDLEKHIQIHHIVYVT